MPDLQHSSLFELWNTVQCSFISTVLHCSVAPEVDVFTGLEETQNPAEKEKIIFDFEFQNGLDTAFIDNTQRDNSLY